MDVLADFRVKHIFVGIVCQGVRSSHNEGITKHAPVGARRSVIDAAHFETGGKFIDGDAQCPEVCIVGHFCIAGTGQWQAIQGGPADADSKLPQFRAGQAGMDTAEIKAFVIVGVTDKEGVDPRTPDLGPAKISEPGIYQGCVGRRMHDEEFPAGGGILNALQRPGPLGRKTGGICQPLVPVQHEEMGGANPEIVITGGGIHDPGTHGHARGAAGIVMQVI